MVVHFGSTNTGSLPNRPLAPFQIIEQLPDFIKLKRLKQFLYNKESSVTHTYRIKIEYFKSIYNRRRYPQTYLCYSQLRNSFTTLKFSEKSMGQSYQSLHFYSYARHRVRKTT